MRKYDQLTNGDNVLLELANAGPIDTETTAALLNVAESTASNILRSLYGRRFLSRKNVNLHQKSGGPKYLYALTSGGRRRVEWVRTRIA